ncbi:MAG: type IV toxin-antitoxin system AbiEi family antitoxin domain-containing protein [Ignavibacteriales bacterium]|nr:type IV toxin-antitoxin system AbiEi family antitoxin domain-containing protein [Ignavibacteriales bacterium]
MYGNAPAIRKALERLVKTGELVRVATGIYVLPKQDGIIGQILPGIEDIAKAIAKRDRARIIPTGVSALNRLGLSPQVPLNVVYLTDGAARKIKIGTRTITFKKTAPKNLSAIGEISSLVIEKKVTLEDIKKIQQLLRKEKKDRLKHDINLAPTWIREVIKPIINEGGNETQTTRTMARVKRNKPDKHI